MGCKLIAGLETQRARNFVRKRSGPCINNEELTTMSGLRDRLSSSLQPAILLVFALNGKPEEKYNESRLLKMLIKRSHVSTIGGPTPPQPLPTRPTHTHVTPRLSTKAGRQSTLGYTHGSSLSVDSMVTQDTDKLFIQVRPPSWRNTYVLRLVVLICVERISCMVCPLGDPCPSLYILKGQSYKQSILFGTKSCSLAVHADQSCVARLHLVGRATSDGAARIGP